MKLPRPIVLIATKSPNRAPRTPRILGNLGSKAEEGGESGRIKAVLRLLGGVLYGFAMFFMLGLRMGAVLFAAGSLNFMMLPTRNPLFRMLWWLSVAPLG